MILILLLLLHQWWSDRVHRKCCLNSNTEPWATVLLGLIIKLVMNLVTRLGHYSTIVIWDPD